MIKPESSEQHSAKISCPNNRMVSKVIYDEVKTVTTYVKHGLKGKQTVKQQEVHLKNGQGFKEVRYKETGKKTRRSRKKLTKQETRCLKRCKFSPFLFKKCNEECLQME